MAIGQQMGCRPDRMDCGQLDDGQALGKRVIRVAGEWTAPKNQRFRIGRCRIVDFVLGDGFSGVIIVVVATIGYCM